MWGHTGNRRCKPDALMARLANIGTTVYAKAAVRKDSTEMIGHGTHTGIYFDLKVARAARRHGIRYFGAAWLSHLPDFAAKHPHRLSQRADGQPYFGTWGCVINRPCPLDKQLYEKWFLTPCLETAKTKLVGGIHLDWGPYTGRDEAGVCYYNDCFQIFLNQNSPQTTLPPLEKRHDMLIEQEFVETYGQFFHERRSAIRLSHGIPTAARNRAAW